MTAGAPSAPSADRSLSILVISHVGSVWGAQQRLLDLAPQLADEGIRLTMASPEGDLSERWMAAGLSHQTLDLPAHGGVRRDGGGRPGPVALAVEVATVVRSAGVIARRARPFDLVQSHSLFAHLETSIAGTLARRPVVLDLHDIVSDGVGRRVLGAAARLATMVLANSAATASTVPGAQNTTTVVHPGVDITRFHPGPVRSPIRSELTSDPAAPLIAILGRVDPNKGVDTVIEAIGRTRSSTDGAHLVVVGREHVGDPEYIGGLRRRATEVLGDRVRFLPPREDVPDVLRAVDVLVNASLHEPFGRTVLEAQACGIPVVGTNAGGIPEFVTDGETGLLVPPFDAVRLEEALVRLLGDADLRDRLSRQGAEQARTGFSLQSQARAVAVAYRRAAGG